MKVVIADYLFEDLEPEATALRGLADLVAVRTFPGPAGILELARDADALVSQGSSITSEIIDGLERCRVIARYGVGVDNIDVAAATRRGIPVCNVPDYCTDDVADHALMLITGLIRRLPSSIEYTRSGGWNHNPLRPIRRLSALTLGIYGLGRIGKAVARRARGFGFTVLAFDPYLDDKAFTQAGVERVDREALLARSDVLTLHVPLTAETRGQIDAPTLAALKPGSFLINTARGPVVKTPALIEALDSGRLAGAALDVLDVEPIPVDHPLWSRPNVLMTPHLAWFSEESLRQLQRQIGEECARVLRGESPRNAVNPEYRDFAG